jgi:hypothetical protein
VSILSAKEFTQRKGKGKKKWRGGVGWEGGEATCGITVIKPSYSGR